MTGSDISQQQQSSILIVDDNPQNLQVLGKILQENNYKIEFSISGETALKWLATRQFDLILLDINMPGMDGFEVCRRIRSNPDLDIVPVIFLSADTDRESIFKGFELGAQDYITKPFDSRELLVRVRTHLKLKDTLEKLARFNKSLEEIVVERTFELKNSNEKLEASNIKLLNLDMAKARFLSLISHEIRTPLNGITGPLELLKGSGNSKEVSDLIEMLDISVKRLEEFSLNALLITRLKTNQYDVKKDKIELPDLINELLEEGKEKFRPEVIRLSVNKKFSGSLITGESILIKKCIENILENAIRFSAGKLPVEMTIYDEPGTVICEIKDKGKGFADGNTEEAFELFTTDEMYRDNSIGIGLPISKMIMEAIGGRIMIGNNPDAGAYVKLLFRKHSNN